MTPPRILMIGAVPVLVGTFAVLVLRNGLGDRPAKAQSTGGAGASGPASSGAAPAATPLGGAGPPTVTLAATLIADETVELYAKASGYISDLQVDIGSRVRKGDVLLRLDIPEMLDDVKQNAALLSARKAKVESAKAKAALARLAVESALARQKRVQAEWTLCKITCQRKAQLIKEKAIPQQEYDVAESQLAISEADLAMAAAGVAGARGEVLAAEADVQSAEADLGVAIAEGDRLKTLLAYAAVTAPFDGVITRRDVDRGAFVRSAAQGAGAALLRLERVDRLRLVLDVPETLAPLIRPGTAVQIQFRANGDETLTAPVTRSAAALRSDTRTMRAEVDLDNAAGRLLPGMYAKVTVRPPPTNPSGE
ncbi:MAG: multidrug resistance protein [Phycisphaerae bacterium]